MPKMTYARSSGKRVSIEAALEQRELAKKSKTLMPKYLCLECGNLVRPHKAGPNNPAYYEHLNRNKECSLSHKT